MKNKLFIFLILFAVLIIPISAEPVNKSFDSVLNVTILNNTLILSLEQNQIVFNISNLTALNNLSTFNITRQFEMTFYNITNWSMLNVTVMANQSFVGTLCEIPSNRLNEIMAAELGLSDTNLKTWFKNELMPSQQVLANCTAIQSSWTALENGYKTQLVAKQAEVNTQIEKIDLLKKDQNMSMWLNVILLGLLAVVLAIEFGNIIPFPKWRFRWKGGID